MKKALIILAAAFALSGCLSTKQETKNEAKMVGMANPFFSFKSLEEAQKKAGFDFYILDVFEDYTVQVYRTIPKQLLEGIYDSESGDEIRIRKAPGKNDPSGDYNIYTEKSSQTIHGYEVIFYANENKCGKVVWQMGAYTCSVTSRDRMSLSKALRTATKIIEMNKDR